MVGTRAAGVADGEGEVAEHPEGDRLGDPVAQGDVDVPGLVEEVAGLVGVALELAHQAQSHQRDADAHAVRGDPVGGDGVEQQGA